MAKEFYGKSVRRHKNAEAELQTVDDAAESEKLPTRPPKDRFRSKGERVAQSDIFTKNWYYPGSAIAFPHDLNLRKVDQYFPYAKGGPLLIDFPENEAEVMMCRKKEPILLAKGFRYLIWRPGMNEAAALTELEVKYQ